MQHLNSLRDWTPVGVESNLLQQDSSNMHYHQLTYQERYHIEEKLTAGKSLRWIAGFLNRAVSTIKREIDRNTLEGIYQAEHAHNVTDARRKAATKHSAITTKISAQIDAGLQFGMSPMMISNRLCIEGQHKVSHETIYRYILKNKQKGGSLYKHLCHAPKPYKKRFGSHDRRGQIADRKTIHERPLAANERSELGHLEGDTIHGKRGSLVTVNDRKSRFLVIKYVPNRTSDEVTPVLSQAVKRLGGKTITCDNGKEFSKHKSVAEDTGADVYFADPYCSYQRGSNENLNGIIRRYFPKGTNFDDVSEEHIQVLQTKINLLPKACLNWRTPYEVHFKKCVALMG